MFSDDYSDQYESALQSDSDVDWNIWLAQVPDEEEKCELALYYFQFGAEYFNWDFHWLSDKWHCYGDYLQKPNKVESVQELYQHHLDCRCNPNWKEPKWSDYQKFGIDAETLHLTKPNSPIYLGAVLNDKYLVDHYVGHGSFGMVFRARCLGTDRDVAIKIALCDCDRLLDYRCSTIIAEAEVIQEIAGPYVPDFYEHFEYNMLPVIAMQYINGAPILDLPRITKKQKAQIAGHLIQVIELLDLIYANGIIHYDLNPKNLLLVGESSSLYFIDFGLSGINSFERWLGFQKKRTATLKNTPVFYRKALGSTQNPDDSIRPDLQSIMNTIRHVMLGDSCDSNETHDIVTLRFRSILIPDQKERIQKTYNVHVSICDIMTMLCANENIDPSFNNGFVLAQLMRLWLQRLTVEEVTKEKQQLSNYWVFLKRCSLIWEQLQKCLCFAKKSIRLFEYCTDRSVAESHFISGARCILTSLQLLVFSKTNNLPVEIDFPPFYYAHYHNLCHNREKRPTIEEARWLCRAAEEMITSVKKIVRQCETKAYEASEEIGNLVSFGLAANGMMLRSTAETTLEELGRKTVVPEEIWTDHVHALLSSNNFDESLCVISELNRRVEEYIHFNCLLNDLEEEPKGVSKEKQGTISPFNLDWINLHSSVRAMETEITMRFGQSALYGLSIASIHLTGEQLIQSNNEVASKYKRAADVRLDPD